MILWLIMLFLILLSSVMLLVSLHSFAVNALVILILTFGRSGILFVSITSRILTFPFRRVAAQCHYKHPPPDSMEGAPITPLGLPWRHMWKESLSPLQNPPPPAPPGGRQTLISCLWRRPQQHFDHLHQGELHFYLLRQEEQHFLHVDLVADTVIGYSFIQCHVACLSSLLRY